MPYGQAGRMGDTTTPGLFNPDFSGYERGAAAKASGVQQLAGGVSEMVKQRVNEKKRDAQNEKFLQQAVDMFQGTGLEEPVRSAYQQYISEETTDKERRAIGESIRETIGLGLHAQKLKMAMAGGGSDWKPRYQEVPMPGGGTMLMEVMPNGQLAPLRAEGIAEMANLGLPQQQPQEPQLDGSFWYGQDIAPQSQQGVTVDGMPGVLPTRSDDPYLREPTAPVGGWNTEPTLPGDPAAGQIPMPPAQDGSQDAASQIMASLVQSPVGQQPQAAPAPAPIQDAVIGYTPPETPERWSDPYKDPESGRPVIRNLDTGEVKDYSKGDGMQINVTTQQGLKEKGLATQMDRNNARYDELVAASQALPELGRLSQLANKGIDTGSLAELKLEAKKLFGQDVADEEEFRRLSGQLAMSWVEKTKGAVSDKEMDIFFNVLAPSIKTSPEGNKRAVEFALDAARRAKEQAKIIRDMQRDGADPYEIADALDAHTEANQKDWIKKFDLGVADSDGPAPLPTGFDPELDEIINSLGLE